jgi:hypothetical protein
VTDCGWPVIDTGHVNADDRCVNSNINCLVQFLTHKVRHLGTHVGFYTRLRNQEKCLLAISSARNIRIFVNFFIGHALKPVEKSSGLVNMGQKYQTL